jgi:hypothetical protein
MQRPRQVLVPKDGARDEAESPTPVQLTTAEPATLSYETPLCWRWSRTRLRVIFDRLPRGDCAQLHRELKGIRRREGV